MSNDDVDMLFRPANPLESAAPPAADFSPGAVTIIPAGTTAGEGALPTPIDIELTQDLAIGMRDGVTLYGDVYRAAGAGPVPALLIYTPYVKRGGWFNEAVAVTKFGAPGDWVSGLQPFEALDPAYWCAHGYAIVVVDARGTGHSEGDMFFMGTGEGKDAYDTIEWIAAQPWCTGKVAMAGNSQLAMVQWAVAALKPPHLAAIAPWEGLTDCYGEVVSHGGIPDVAFHDDFIIANLVGRGQFEDVSAMLERQPIDSPYWADKRADLSAIEVPAYVVSSWTNFIHTRTTQKAFEQIASKEKWLRIHNTHEWIDIATPENVDDLRRFFDRYLLGAENGWEDTSFVRYCVLDPGGADLVGLTADTWPPRESDVVSLYLDAEHGALTSTAPTAEATARYASTSDDDAAVFTLTADEELTVIGPLNLQVWAEIEEGTDLDLFVAVYKTDETGKPLYHVVYPALKHIAPMLEQQGKLSSIVAYAGPSGRLRASHRALDDAASTELEPHLTHAREDALEPGVPVLLEIGLWPTALVVHPGETLVLEIAGHPAGPFKVIQPGAEEPDVVPTRNVGTHILHTGGQRASRLLIPVATS